MTKLIPIASLTALILFVSGCGSKEITTAKVDNSVQTVDYNSIKSISDMTSIAFEWQKVDDPKVTGYNFYRVDMKSGNRTLKLIKTIKNRYTTHFLDTKLQPNTTYAYQITSRVTDEIESRSTEAYTAQTLARLEPVNSVSAISNLPNRIKILWRPHEDRKVEYYKVQRYDAGSEKWKDLEDVKGRLQAEYMDLELESNKAYRYRVIAYTFDNVASNPSQDVTAKTKKLPQGVSNASVSSGEPRKITLTWSASPTEDVIKYAIYRSPYETVGFSKLVEVNTNASNVVDKIDEDGKDYYYKILAVDKDGLQSSEKIDSIKGTTLDKPATPEIISSKYANGSVVLNWKTNDDRAVSFNVYKDMKLNLFETKTIKFGKIQSNSFEDNNIQSDANYKYSVQAVDQYGLISEQSDTVTLKLPQKAK